MGKNRTLVSFKNLSKKYQMILAISALLVVVSAGFCVFIPVFVEDLLDDNFKAACDAITSSVINDVSDIIVDSSHSGTKSPIERVVKRNMISLRFCTSMTVFDRNGDHITKAINNNYPALIQLYYPEYKNTNYVDDLYNLLVINRDIKRNGKKIGKITAIFSMESIEKEVRNIQYKIILACLLLLILEIVVVSYVSKLISNPLGILLDTFAKIARGNLNERAHITTNEEFGRLARAFNSMVENLEESYFELAEANKNMELKIEKRTIQLREQIEVRTETEEQLKSVNSMVISIINTSPLPIITLSTDFKVQTASPAIKSAFLYEEYEIIDKIIPIIYTTDIDFFIDSLKKITTSTQTEKIITKGRRKNGQLLDLSVAATAEMEPNGNIIKRYIIVVDDITERLVAERALKDSEAKYKSIIEDTVIGIALVRGDNFTFVNNALVEMCNYPSSNELIAVSFMDIVHNDDRGKVLDIYNTRDIAMDGDVEFDTVEISLICYDAKEKNVELSVKTIIIDEYPVLQITFVDITERKAAEIQMKQMNIDLEERVSDRTSQLNKTLLELRQEMNKRTKLSKELEFKSEILERTTSVVIVWDKKGECIFLSPWAISTLGFSQEKLLGSGIWDIINTKENMDISITRANIQRILSKDIPLPTDYYTLEVTTAQKKKKYIKLQHTFGQGDTLITAGAEITEQIESQNELQVLSDRLAKALDGEKELNELKTRFISMVSHEFRTPLTVIMSCSAIIEQAIENHRLDIAGQYVEKIVKSVKTMNELMEDVLVIGKSTSTRIETVTEMDFVAFVKQSLEDIQEAYTFSAQAELIVNSEIDGFYSNEPALKHVVHNLITNALKYSDSKPVTITIDEADSNLIFSVADHGIGIPQADLKRLFSNFFRASNVGKIAGTGLGLNIVKQSVDNLYGTIDVVSEVNVGTTFTVILPKDIRGTLAEAAAQAEKEADK